MIYTLTLNPAVDYVVRLPELREGETNRASSASIRFGGKGINVSLVLRELGVESTALGFIGGFTGIALADHLAALGIPSDFISLPDGMTRINIKLNTAANETEINAPGPRIPSDALQALSEKLCGATSTDTVILAGSVPPTLPVDLYARIMARAGASSTRFVVDAEGESLRSTLPFHPYLIKPNRTELESLIGEPLSTEDALRDAARSLQCAGARNVLVSLGEQGALLLDEEGCFHRAAAFSIRPVSTVGAGDSMVAGFLAGAARGYEYAMKLGIAAGSATAETEGLASRKAILRYMA